jgi:hypothetical protein
MYVYVCVLAITQSSNQNTQQVYSHFCAAEAATDEPRTLAKKEYQTDQPLQRRTGNM